MTKTDYAFIGALMLGALVALGIVAHHATASIGGN